MPIFLSNRVWLIREGLEFSLLPAEPPRPRLLLHRTSTRIALPTRFQMDNDLSPVIRREWEKRNLIEN
jgi:hypothetical protein